MALRARMSKAVRSRLWSWRYVYNLVPTLAYRFGAKPALGEEARSVVDALDRDGLAVTTVEALLGSGAPFERVREGVRERETAHGAEVSAARDAADARDDRFTKHFVYTVVQDGEAAPGDPYWDFANDPVIRSVVDAYLGLRAAFRDCYVIRNFRVGEAPFASQLWHRDRDDFLLIKVFLYLDDVGEGGGAFQYARRTHPKLPLCPMPEHSLEGHVARSTNAQLEAVVPRSQWAKVLGPAGTLVFADTRGYHKGGRCRTSERLLYRAMYGSTGSLRYLDARGRA